jgi:hypothetical protein
MKHQLQLVLSGFLFYSFTSFAVSSPSPSPSYVPLSTVSPTPTLKKVEIDPKVMLKEFTRAQSSELKALEHRNKFEFKELKASQALKLKEWEKKEKEARYRFFETHAKGPERRAYVQDFIKRRDALRKQLAEERTLRSDEYDATVDKLRQEQATRLKQFKKSLDQGTPPPLELWPMSGS